MSDEDLKLLADARKLVGEGRYEEAKSVALAVLEGNPYSVKALAIKGDCHERVGEYSQALECYRDILLVSPDSQLDRIRAERLEKIVMSGEIEIGRPNPKRKTALGAAIAAAILLVSSGSALILAAQSPSSPTQSSSADPQVQSQPFLPVPYVPGNTGYAPNEQAAPQDPAYDGLDTSSGLDLDPMVRPGTAQPLSQRVLNDVPRGGTNSGTNDLTGGENVRPLQPDLGGTRPGQSPPTGDPDPKVVNDNGGGNRNMIVDVQPSRRGEPSTGNVQVEDRAIQIEALIRVAREQQVLGNFAKAADAYEKALALGASPASTNQRLAQCYSKLNRKSDAIRAYERAIKAFELMDQNDIRVQTQLESCRAELSALRGA